MRASRAATMRSGQDSPRCPSCQRSLFGDRLQRVDRQHRDAAGRAASASPCTTAQAVRSPVKLPGPAAEGDRVESGAASPPAPAASDQRISVVEACAPPAPSCSSQPSGWSGLPSATLRRSVLVSSASTRAGLEGGGQVGAGEMDGMGAAETDMA